MKKPKILTFLLVGLLFFLIAQGALFGINRFPRPEFKTDYSIPEPTEPSPQRDYFYDYLDVIVLAGAVLLAAFFVLKARSRGGLYWLGVFSLLYFGFWRKGCVCPVGSLQNVSLGLIDPSFIVPLTVILFFVIPIVAALFFGRTFCSSVCPLGALQELVAIKPQKLPVWLEKPLGLIPYFFLGLGILSAVTGSGFLICRFDPFVGFFRLSSSFEQLLVGGFVLVVCVFVGRAYCRFFCPYGVLLRWASRFSMKHMTTYPKECIKCGLCADACPYGALDKPIPPEKRLSRERGKKDMIRLIFLLPVIVLAAGFFFSLFSPVFSRLNLVVLLAQRIALEKSDPSLEMTTESEAFRQTGETEESLMDRADRIESQFYLGGWLLGIFLGLTVILKMINLTRRKKREFYEVNRGECFSCGRCMEFCPAHRIEKKKGAL